MASPPSSTQTLGGRSHFKPTVRWEKSASDFLGGDSNTTGVSGRISGSGSEDEGKKKSSPTSVHFSQEETPAPYEHIGSTYFPWFGRSKSLASNQKNPVSRCSMKHKCTKLFPSPDAFESVGGASGAAVQSGEKLNELEKCPSNSARRVTRFLSEFLSKWTNQKVVGNGLNFEKKATDFVITVSKTVTSSVQNDKCEVGEEGRLRLPPLEFWRNQSAVYDKDHGVIGIQEELPAVTPSRVHLRLRNEKPTEVDFLAKL